MPKYKHVGSHPEDLASGRVVAPGELVDLKGDEVSDPHNKRLIDEEILVEAAAKKKEGNN